MASNLSAIIAVASISHRAAYIYNMSVEIFFGASSFYNARFMSSFQIISIYSYININFFNDNLSLKIFWKRFSR